MKGVAISENGVAISFWCVARREPLGGHVLHCTLELQFTTHSLIVPAVV